jgi:WD40 repeat protein
MTKSIASLISDEGYVRDVVPTPTVGAENFKFYRGIDTGGDYDGNVGLWEYHSNNEMCAEEDENDGTELPESSKKSKSPTTNTTKKSMETSTTTASSNIMRKISTKNFVRAHTSQVSGVAFRNYAKVQSKSSSSTSSFQRPNQLITGSWDHSIKVWDIERQDNINHKWTTCRNMFGYIVPYQWYRRHRTSRLYHPFMGYSYITHQGCIINCFRYHLSTKSCGMGIWCEMVPHQSASDCLDELLRV